jgi:hypothetical protein
MRRGGVITRPLLLIGDALDLDRLRADRLGDGGFPASTVVVVTTVLVRSTTIRTA